MLQNLHLTFDSLIEHHEAESEEIVMKARPARLRTKQRKRKDESPSKMPEAKTENTNLLLKPKNDDSSESSSIKDSGYEEPENDGTAKNNKDKLKLKFQGSTDSVKKIQKDRGSSGTEYQRKTAKTEAEQSPPPPPVFNLHEINSIWASGDVSDENEETGKTSVESIKNDSDVEYPDDDLVGVTSPVSARTTIIG